jgi:polyferredoxin
MVKVNRPMGLIRYGSKVSIDGGKTRWIRGRTIFYSILLIIGLGVMTYSIQQIGPAHANVLRMKGSPYYVTEQYVRNQFMVRVVNKLPREGVFTVSVVNLPKGVEAKGIDENMVIGRAGESFKPVVVTIDRQLYEGSFDLDFRVRLIEKDYEMAVHAKFIGPDPRLLKEDYEHE